MDIFIKSFNRPYYLERCLKSIFQYVSGEFTIKVLDDGTPSPYLERILQLYPQVQILRSPQYALKVKAINAHIHEGHAFTQTKIPTDFWIEAVQGSTDFFLLLEDDIWLTEPVDLLDVLHTMQADNMAMVRLSWQGNEKLIGGVKRLISEQIEEVQPNINGWRKSIFLNRFKLRSVGYRLGLFRDIMPYQVPMYVLYAVASSFFSKDYWLYLWQGSGQRVNEERQLQKAWHWYRQHHGRSQYGKLRRESAQTSYLTSTHNGYPSGGYPEIKCDMLQVNYWLNEAWLYGNMDCMQGFPADFTVAYLASFLEAAENPAVLYKDWSVWITRFKNDYRRLGCAVD